MEGVHGDFVYYDGIAVQNDSKVDGKLDATYNAFPDITVQGMTKTLLKGPIPSILVVLFTS